MGHAPLIRICPSKKNRFPEMSTFQESGFSSFSPPSVRFFGMICSAGGYSDAFCGKLRQRIQ